MNKTVMIGGALAGAVALTWWANRAPAGLVLAKVTEPGWSERMRKALARAFPGVTSAPGGATAQLQALRAFYGSTEFEGRDVSRAPLGELGRVAGRWSAMLLQSGAVAGWQIPGGGYVVTSDNAGVRAATRWVFEIGARYVALGRWGAGDVVDLAQGARFQRELGELAVALDVQDDSVAAHPDTRTYWDFLWAEAQTSVATKIAFWPIYMPYKAASYAWDLAPGVGKIAVDLFGPAIKFVVTTFGVVLFVGGVGYYVYRKWPGPKPQLPIGVGS